MRGADCFRLGRPVPARGISSVLIRPGAPGFVAQPCPFSALFRYSAYFALFAHTSLSPWGTFSNLPGARLTQKVIPRHDGNEGRKRFTAEIAEETGGGFQIARQFGHQSSVFLTGLLSVASEFSAVQRPSFSPRFTNDSHFFAQRVPKIWPQRTPRAQRKMDHESSGHGPWLLGETCC